MSTIAKPCSLCRKQVSLTAIAAMAGAEAGVRMSIEGMPALICPEGHKRFLAPDFAVKLMDALLGGDSLVPAAPASEKGFLRKHLHCPGCGKALAENTAERIEAKRVLELPGGAPFSVRIELPKFRCAACGKESTLPDRLLGDALMKASVQAFRSVALAPT